MGDLPDFVSQIPLTFFLPVCIPGLLLVMYVTYAGYIRPERRKKQQAAAAPPAAVVATGPSALDLLHEAEGDARPARRIDTGELPDLDLLLAAEEKAPPAAPAVDDSSVRLHNGSSTRAVEALRILRDERDGRLMVQIEGLAYRSLADSPDAKREFTRIMKELSSIILEPDSGNTAPASQPEKPASTAATVPVTATVEETAAAEPAEASPLLDKSPETPSDAPPAPPPPVVKPAIPKGEKLPGDLPSYRYDDNPAVIKSRTLRGPKVEFEAPPAIDIVSAIETYLQFKLSHTDAFRGRSIHVRPSLTGGVRIEVDGNFFEAVDDVSDTEVRDFLKQSIQEWQDRQ